MPDQPDIFHFIQQMDEDKLAIILIFGLSLGTAFVGVLGYGIAKIIRAVRGDVETADELRAQLNHLADQVESLEAAARRQSTDDAAMRV